jgi:hypothetical protein
MHVQASRGAAAEGKHVAVLIDPHWNADERTISVRISCHAFGHLQVNWRQLAVAVIHPEASGSVQHIARFNANGLAVFPSLPPAEYAFRVYERTQQFVQSPRLPERARAAGRGRGRLPERDRAVRTRGQVARQGDELAAHGQLEPQEPRTYTSADGKITATLLPSPEGMRLAFETEEPTLAGQTVAFAFVSEAGDTIACHGEVVLSHQEPETPLWQGEWPHVLPLAEPCELVFQVVPPA